MQFLIVMIVVAFILGIFYLMSSLLKEEKLFFTISAFGIFAFFSFPAVLFYTINSVYPVVVVVEVAIAYILLRKFKKMYSNRLEIKAQQNTYWGIDPKMILENNAHKVIQKRGRKEIDEKYLNQMKTFYHVNEEKNGEKILDNKVLYMIRDFNPEKKLTKIDSLKYFKKDASPLIKKVYEKIVEYDLDAEHEIDFQKMLEDNDYYLEYFIMDGWEKTALYENIGVGTLEQIAENAMEVKLIGAMDSLISSFVVNDGIELLAHFYFHHGRLVKSKNV